MINQSNRYIKIDDEKAINLEFLASNRSFLYGDAVFETMLKLQGVIQLYNHHITRLKKAIAIFGFELSVEKEQQLIDELLLIPFENARIRLAVYRAPGGFYKPLSNDAHFVIDATTQESDHYLLNSKGLSLVTFKQHLKPIQPLSSIKSANAALYVLAANYAKNKGFDEALILNEKKRICESSSSNLFILKGKELYTPALSEACLAGIMRSRIIELADEVGLHVHETKLDINELEDADEIWLTNAARGLQWVGAWEDKRFFSKQAKKMVQLLNQKILS
jgi:branched-chain amino acid aminotransferase